MLHRSRDEITNSQTILLLQRLAHKVTYIYHWKSSRKLGHIGVHFLILLVCFPVATGTQLENLEHLQLYMVIPLG